MITIHTDISLPASTVWQLYTSPEHIVNWNFASPDWHCPSASNNLTFGGKYVARMEARDGSFGFDFEAEYTSVNPESDFAYRMTDGRDVTVELKETENGTRITVSFQPENQNPEDLQRDGWQAILNNFGAYCSSVKAQSPAAAR
jgi:uncharacterized protein YndB with AHSA1/START domain